MAIGFGFFTVKLLLGATKSASITAGFGAAIFGFSSMIIGVLLLAPELKVWAAIPVHRVFNSLIFPGGTIVPPADYRLARQYRKQWRYCESVDEYFKILEYHPEELDAYLEGMATATEARAPKTRQRFYRMGLRKLQNTSDRQQLEEAFSRSAVGNVSSGPTILDKI